MAIRSRRASSSDTLGSMRTVRGTPLTFSVTSSSPATLPGGPALESAEGPAVGPDEGERARHPSSKTSANPATRLAATSSRREMSMLAGRGAESARPAADRASSNVSAAASAPGTAATWANRTACSPSTTKRPSVRVASPSPGSPRPVRMPSCSRSAATSSASISSRRAKTCISSSGRKHHKASRVSATSTAPRPRSSARSASSVTAPESRGDQASAIARTTG